MFGTSVSSFRATLRVSEVWKAPRRETLEVSMPRGGATCGYPFKEGRAYLVYAYEKDPGFGVDLTVRTDAVTMAGVWIGDLNLARAIESRWIVLEGPRHLRWAFPDRLKLSLFAGVERRLERSSLYPRPAVTGTHVE